MSTHFTIQEYVSTFEPGLHDIFMDPAQCYQELRADGDALAIQVGLPVSPEGRYSPGLWEVVLFVKR